MSNLSTTLKQLMQEEQLKTTELARATDILQPVLHKVVTGQTDNPRINTLIPLAAYFNISMEQLLGLEPLPTNRKQRAQLNKNWHSIPLLTDWQQATSSIEEDAHEKILVKSNISKRAYALTVKDSTMLPRFTEGSLLIIEPEATPQNGQFVIVQLTDNDYPVFKQLFFDGSDVYLKPLNPDFKTLYLDKETDYHILGVVAESRETLLDRESDDYAE